jgi:hypothetical protein
MAGLKDKTKEEVDAHFLEIRKEKEAGIKRFYEA